MARSTFYYHLKRLGNTSKYKEEKKRIKEIFQESKGRYGYRRITLQLRNDGYVINHKTVEKLMQDLGIKCLIRKKRYRSYKGTVQISSIGILRQIALIVNLPQMCHKYQLVNKKVFCRL